MYKKFLPKSVIMISGVAKTIFYVLGKDFYHESNDKK